MTLRKRDSHFSVHTRGHQRSLWVCVCAPHPTLYPSAGHSGDVCCCRWHFLNSHRLEALGFRGLVMARTHPVVYVRRRQVAPEAEPVCACRAKGSAGGGGRAGGGPRGAAGGLWGGSAYRTLRAHLEAKTKDRITQHS